MRSTSVVKLFKFSDSFFMKQKRGMSMIKLLPGVLLTFFRSFTMYVLHRGSVQWNLQVERRRSIDFVQIYLTRVGGVLSISGLTLGIPHDIAERSAASPHAIEPHGANFAHTRHGRCCRAGVIEGRNRWTSGVRYFKSSARF